MEQKKESWSGIITFGIVLGLFFLLVVVECFLIPSYLEAHGTLQIVTVSYHKTIHSKGKSPYMVSCGYYYVEGKRYNAQIGKKHPIGTKFEIKYYPKMPKRYEINKNKIIIREQ